MSDIYRKTGRRAPACVALAWLLAGGLAAQPVQTKPLEKLPPALERIVEASRQTPAEFHTYALLVLVESGRIENKTAALKLLGEALEAAQAIGQKMDRTPAVEMDFAWDSDVGVFLFKHDLEMARTHLLARAITDADKLDPAAARAMFAETNWPQSEPAGCGEAMVDDSQTYYELLIQLARNRAANRKDGEDSSGLLLEAGIDRIRTHREAELALHAINHSEMAQRQYEEAIHLYVDRLVNLGGDERGFAAELPQLQNEGSGGWTGNLKTALARLDATDAQLLARSFRDYLVTNLRAGACGENHARTAEAATPLGVVSFNRQLAAELAQNGVKPIAPEEIGAGVTRIAAEVHAYGQSQEARELTAAAELLRVNSSGEPRTLEDLNSAAWAEQLTRFLGRVDDWPADPFHSEDELWMKMKFYSAPIYLAPRPEQRRMVMERAVAMLENSNLESEDPALEMVLVTVLYVRERSQADGKELEKRGDDDFLRRLATSRSASLRLLGLMETENLKALRDTL